MKKAIKRALVIAMCFFSVMFAMSSSTLAASKTSGKCGKKIKWSYNTKTKTLTISGKGKMEDYYRSRPRPWDDYKDDIKKIIIKKGITSTGGNSFYICERLEKISIAKSVKEIDEASFQRCNNLREVKIPKGVKTIRACAFSDNDNLRKVVISGSVKKIEAYAFGECPELSKVTLSNGIKEIGDEAFNACPNLKTVSIPNSVKKIGNVAFGYETIEYDLSSGKFVGKDKVEGFTIYGKKGSAAEKYAKKNGFTFKESK